MQENWSSIAGYEGLYEVSDMGRVRSVARGGTKGGILSAHRSRYGYMLVSLFKNNIRTGFSIHKLVATAFIPNPNNLPQVNHKDEDKTNNHVENLEWCTASYNMNYGGRPYARSKPITQKEINGNPIVEYKSIMDAVRQIGVNKGNIVECLKGRRKTAGGYIWTYK